MVVPKGVPSHRQVEQVWLRRFTEIGLRLCGVVGVGVGGVGVGIVFSCVVMMRL